MWFFGLINVPQCVTLSFLSEYNIAQNAASHASGSYATFTMGGLIDIAHLEEALKAYYFVQIGVKMTFYLDLRAKGLSLMLGSLSDDSDSWPLEASLKYG